MISFVIAFILLDSICCIPNLTNIFSLSPLCNKLANETVIDSIVAKDSQIFYYFIGDTITVVNQMTETIENVMKINDYFTTTNAEYLIESPIDTAFIQSNHKRILYLINLNIGKQWQINVEKNTIIDSKSITSNERQVFIGAIDLFNINDTFGYLFFMNTSLSLIYGKPLIFGEFTFISSVYLRNKRSEIALTDDITIGDSNRAQLNGFDITSGFIFSNSIYFIANRFQCKLNLSVNKWSQFLIHNFTDELCQPKAIKTTTVSTTSQQTSATPKTTTTTTGHSTLQVISGVVVFILLMIVIVLLVLIVLRQYVKRTKKGSQKLPKLQTFPKKRAKPQSAKKDLKSKSIEETIGFEATEKDFSKPVPLKGAKSSLSTTSSDRPTDLKIN